MNGKLLILYITLAAGASKALEKGCASGAERAAQAEEKMVINAVENPNTGEAIVNATSKAIATQDINNSELSSNYSSEDTSTASRVKKDMIIVFNYLSKDLPKENKYVTYDSDTKTFNIDNTK